MSVTDMRDADPVLVAPILVTLSKDLDGGFVELFSAYRRLVFSVAVRVCGHWAEAEDLTAEAFLRAYRALRGYQPERILALRPRARLVTILLNVWRNHTRTVARRPATANLASVAEPVDPHADIAEAIEQHETGRELAEHLAQLPERQRIAVVLRHVHDLPITEIADVLGCPPGTVKSHISRGLRRLRELSAARPKLCEVTP